MADAASRPADGRQSVLVVDDEADIRESLRMLLESSLEAVEVEVAASGAAALALLEARPVDLVITDYKMPGMNGLDFLARAQKVAPRTPRILITAFPDLEIAIRAINEAGVENFFTKPFEPEQVVAVVRDVLQEQRAATLRSRGLERHAEAARWGERR